MIDAKARKKQARKAGKISGRKRAAKNKERDENIYLAYKFLVGDYQSNKDRLKSLEFIMKFGRGVNLCKGESPLSFLADRVGLTRQRIDQIIRNKLKRLN